MGEKKGRASASGPRDPLELLIADAADSQILDDQTVRDILETDSYARLDQSIGDNRHDKGETELTETDVLYDHLTSATSLVEAISLLEIDTEEPESIEATSGNKTGRNRRDPC